VPLVQRVIYAESASRGLSVIEAAPKSEAARELFQLTELVLPKSNREAA
jgi:chromosome partitioning protein